MPRLRTLALPLILLPLASWGADAIPVRTAEQAWSSATGPRPGSQTPGSEASPTLDPALFTPFEKRLVALKGLGLGEVVKEMLPILEQLGMPADRREYLGKRLARTKVKTPRSKSQKKSHARKVTKAVAALKANIGAVATAVLEMPAGDDRSTAAELVLKLDGSQTELVPLLGFAQDAAGQWRTPEAIALIPRQQAIQEALLKAHQLEPEVTVSESGHELLAYLFGEPGIRVQHGRLILHTNWPAAKARRIVKNLVRVTALSRWLLGPGDGDVALPEDLRFEMVLFTGEAPYRKAIAFDRAQARARNAELDQAPQLQNYFRKDGSSVMRQTAEGQAIASIACDVLGTTNGGLRGKARFPCLSVGHTNWVLLAMFGEPIPGIQYDPDEQVGTSTDLRRNDQLLVGAGLMGARTWLKLEAARSQDPPWSRSFVDSLGKVDGVNLLKATFVVEYLQQLGPLEPLLDAAAPAIELAKNKQRGEVVAHMAEVVGGSLNDFEERWRRWIVDRRPTFDSALGRLRRQIEGAGTPDARGDTSGSQDSTPADALKHLQRYRDLAHRGDAPFGAASGWLKQVPKLAMLPDLSAHARLHAAYLNRHPDQAAAWPDAHEEYTDREGFTPEGAWSGGHSVIAPGSGSAAAAIDAWMATFFHRLPLLEPGWLRAGYAQVDGMAVLDTHSVVRTLPHHWLVVWPPVDGKSIPLRCRPELPNPFPGEDQNELGYPITVQVQLPPNREIPDLRVTLRAGDEEVPCLASSPQSPGNPLLVPELAWCLYPKAHLKPNTTYEVEVAGLPKEMIQGAGNPVSWSFRTGG